MKHDPFSSFNDMKLSLGIQKHKNSFQETDMEIIKKKSITQDLNSKKSDSMNMNLMKKDNEILIQNRYLKSNSLDRSMERLSEKND